MGACSKQELLSEAGNKMFGLKLAFENSFLKEFLMTCNSPNMHATSKQLKTTPTEVWQGLQELL